jgi:hypothetical protein
VSVGSTVAVGNTVGVDVGGCAVEVAVGSGVKVGVRGARRLAVTTGVAVGSGAGLIADRPQPANTIATHNQPINR